MELDDFLHILAEVPVIMPSDTGDDDIDSEIDDENEETLSDIIMDRIKNYSSEAANRVVIILEETTWDEYEYGITIDHWYEEHFDKAGNAGNYISDKYRINYPDYYEESTLWKIKITNVRSDEVESIRLILSDLMEQCNGKIIEEDYDDDPLDDEEDNDDFLSGIQ